VEPNGATGFPVGLHTNKRKKAPRTLRWWSFLENFMLELQIPSGIVKGIPPQLNKKSKTFNWAGGADNLPSLKG